MRRDQTSDGSSRSDTTSPIGDLVASWAGPALKQFAELSRTVALSWQGPLPGILAELDRIIGRELTLRLALAFGGCRVYVGTPDTPDLLKRSPIARAVGFEAATLIAAEYGGVAIAVPAGPASVAWRTRMMMRTMIVAGASLGTTARACSVTERAGSKNKALLVRWGVLANPERESSRPENGLARLLIAELTPLPDVARQVGLTLAQVKQEAALMKKRRSV